MYILYGAEDQQVEQNALVEQLVATRDQYNEIVQEACKQTFSKE